MHVEIGVAKDLSQFVSQPLFLSCCRGRRVHLSTKWSGNLCGGHRVIRLNV